LKQKWRYFVSKPDAVWGPLLVRRTRFRPLGQAGRISAINVFAAPIGTTETNGVPLCTTTTG